MPPKTRDSVIWLLASAAQTPAAAGSALVAARVEELHAPRHALPLTPPQACSLRDRLHRLHHRHPAAAGSGLLRTLVQVMGRSPVELRMGSTGAGLFVGCGVGVGIVTPVALHSIPVLGQLSASLSASLGSLNAATGGFAGAARGRLRGLGVRHLDAGFGCGMMLGYGWGAGIMLSPTAQQSIGQGLQAAGRALLAKLPQPLQAALQQRQHGLAAPAVAGLGAAGGLGSWQDPMLAQHQLGIQYAGECPA